MTRSKPTRTNQDVGTPDLTSHVPLSPTFQETSSESQDVTPGRDGTGRTGRPPYRGGHRVLRPTVPKIPIEELFPPSRRTAMSRMKDPPEQAQPITSPQPAEQSPRERKSRLVRFHGHVQALAVARMFIRGQCSKTEHLQRLQTADRIADACRNWAVANSMPAFVTTLVMRAALQIENVRDYCDGYRPTTYALRIIRREIDLPSRSNRGQE